MFNPSFPYGWGHTVVGFYITTGFVVMGVAACTSATAASSPESRRMLSATLWLLLAWCRCNSCSAILTACNMREHQPTKLAAIEGRWETAPACR